MTQAPLDTSQSLADRRRRRHRRDGRRHRPGRGRGRAPVRLLDSRPDVAARAVDGIRAQFAKMAEKGRLTAADAAAAERPAGAGRANSPNWPIARWSSRPSSRTSRPSRQLYADLEAIVAPSCIFGTNTSSISVTAIGAALRHPERLAGLHFFNPAPLMALVEIVSGLATDRAVAETLFATAAAWGKTPVHAKSTPGFIVNRVARPYYAEALRLAQEGAADYATLDAVLREAGGFRMGPFELMDMIGNDVNFAVTNSVWRAFFHDPRFLPSLLQQELVDAGFLGRKSGRGFHDYREGAARPAPQTEPAQARPGENRRLRRVDRSRCLGRAPGRRRHRLRPQRIRRRPHRRSRRRRALRHRRAQRHAARRRNRRRRHGADRPGARLRHGQPHRRRRSPRSATPAAIAAAIGLLQAAGFAVSRFADVPGLAVMRTVAMLANEAADAVNQGVCSAAGADAAMCLGVNYPLGPLAWADRLGLSRPSATCSPTSAPPTARTATASRRSSTSAVFAERKLP